MRTLRFVLAWALAASLAVGSGGLCAEPAPPASAAPPAPPAPVDKVTLDVRGLDIDNLLQFYSRTFSLTIIKDPNLTGPVTIMCPQPVSRQEAFDILNSVVGVRGFTCILTGNVMKIVTVAKAVQSNVGLSVGRTSTQSGDLVITQLVPLKGSADAAQLQAALTPLITAGGSVIADAASNTLTITDYASNITRLLQIIDQLDSANATQFHVFPLTYAQAADVAPLLTQVFFTVPRAAGTSGVQLPGFLQRLTGGTAGGQGARGSVTSVPFGQAVADTRTNSVLVSAGKERMDAIAEVIKGLDLPIERKGNLTVVPLRRANAVDVATALNQALGARTTAQARTTATTTSARSGAQGRTTPAASAGNRIGTAVPTRANEGPAAGNSPPSRAEAPAAEATGGPSGQAPVVTLGPLAGLAGVAGYAAAQAANVVQLGGNVSVVAEPNTNSLIISADPEYALMVQQLIEQLDQAPPQVLIEAIVAEVSLDAERKLGFEWSSIEHPTLGNSNLTGTLGTSFGLAAEGATGLTYALAGSNFNALVHALASDNSVNILSTPRIFTSNNRPAQINISTATPYVNSVLVSTGVSQTFGVQYLDVGVILDVTPQISPDGTVTMQVSQQANELLGFQNLGNNITAPTVATRSAQATIRVTDGQTVILGGIISDNVTRNVEKVPLLGDIPLLGNLFRHSTVSKKKTELLVFLTPRVVRTPEEAAALTRSEQAKSIAPMPAIPAAKGTP